MNEQIVNENILTTPNPIHYMQHILKDELGIIDEIISKKTKNHDHIIEAVTDYVLKSGGKRIRPILVILSALLFEYKGDKHLLLASAVELIHMATLLHDDVVDQSSMRRGFETANKKWNNKTSILVGDFLFSQAFCLMSETENIQILKLLSKVSSVLAEGEVIQMNNEHDIDLTIDKYLEIIEYKTASLFSASCQVGAILANQSDSIIHLMGELGRKLGLTFQIMDDLLDYTSESSKFGKNPGDDFIEGKVTLPLIVTYSLANEKDKKWIKEVLLFENRKDYFKMIQEMMKKYNIFERIHNIATEFINEAKTHLDKLPDNEIKFSINAILNYSLIRDY